MCRRCWTLGGGCSAWIPQGFHVCGFFFFPVESLMEPVVKKKKGAEAGFAWEGQGLILLNLWEEQNLSCHKTASGSAMIWELEEIWVTPCRGGLCTIRGDGNLGAGPSEPERTWGKLRTDRCCVQTMLLCWASFGSKIGQTEPGLASAARVGR